MKPELESVFKEQIAQGDGWIGGRKTGLPIQPGVGGTGGAVRLSAGC